MRVSNNQIYHTFLKYDKTRQENIARYTNQIASGKRILNPSDDIVAVAKSLKVKETANELDGYLRNITTIENHQIAAQTALTNIYDAAQDARAEIVRLLNHGVLDQEDAEIVDDYLQGLKNYIIDQANTKIGDTYLFAGTKSDTKPFNPDGTYNGNNKTQTVPVSKGYEVDSTFNGKEVLGAQSGKIKIVEMIDRIHDKIQAGTLTGIDDSWLEEFDKGMEEISRHRSFIGSQQKNVEDFRLQHEAYKTMYNDMIAKFEDADIAEAVAKLEQSKVAYEASMAVFSQNKDLSLLKYFAA
ncbi:flagellar hook-associated protein FlgL [Nitratiruptor tergarcus]|uniref:Flagellar hook-associated protein 3 FlgL n=1 Tax=Nitratiruptor tergarcus DSM 16512 TaxID=1069081 RepID=A0A1W1WSP4_9BACT|nr:flagellar hook-associated protein FlgL [Nitratiruptor tergarcus]SMC09314.1 flagellar hook-associated protein 3 FlgL [Nitratiruptor tergarcus DSM 16512]